MRMRLKRGKIDEGQRRSATQPLLWLGNLS